MDSFIDLTLTKINPFCRVFLDISRITFLQLLFLRIPSIDSDVLLQLLMRSNPIASVDRLNGEPHENVDFPNLNQTLLKF